MPLFIEVFYMFRLRPFLFLKAVFSAQGICFRTHAVWRTKLCSAVKRKCEWERFWDVDKEEGREIGGEFLILQSASPPTLIILLVPPSEGAERRRGRGGEGEREWPALRFG